MTDNKKNQPDKTGNIRDKQGKFTKGYSGNPKGKPKGSLSITARIKEELKKRPKGQKISYLEALVKTILQKALIEKDKEMIKTIWQFVDGLPKQHIDMDNDDQNIDEIRVVIVTNDGNSAKKASDATRQKPLRPNEPNKAKT